MEMLLPEIRCMEPINSEEPSYDDNFLYQVKWDGVRMLAAIGRDKLTLINKKGNLRSDHYPELRVLSGMLKNNNAILDGEVVVLRAGKPSFSAIMQRDNCRNPVKIHYLSEKQSVSYMVFDLLFLDGRDLRSWSLEARLAQLEELIKDQGCLHLVESFAEGRILFDSVQKAGLEGIVAKNKKSRYYPGKHHKDWFKIKCRRKQNCLVGGYTLRGKQVNALLLGVMRNGSLSFAGKAGNGLSADQWQMLSETLPGLEVRDSPFSGRTPAGSHYINPYLGVEAEYLEWTDSLQLRFPVIKALNTARTA